MLNAPRVLIRNTPTKAQHLVPGQLFTIKGKGEGIEMLPAQVFRFERYGHVENSPTVLLLGTLWWKQWVGDRAFSGVMRNHWLAEHHVGIGKAYNGRHDFHLERIERHQVPSVLGFGRIYSEFVADYRVKPTEG